MVEEAKRRWEASGHVASPNWSRLHLTIMNLGGYLGLTDSDGLMRIDDDGAEMSWFVDATPADDGEFESGSDVEFTAVSGSAADGRYDLLTTIPHELGNYLGFQDVSAATPPAVLTTESIGVGTRRIPPIAALATVAAAISDESFATSPSLTHANDVIEDATPGITATTVVPSVDGRGPAGDDAPGRKPDTFARGRAICGLACSSQR